MDNNLENRGNPEMENQEEQYQHIARTLKEAPVFISTSESNPLVNKQLLFLAAIGVKPVCEVDAGHWQEVENGRVAVPDDEAVVKSLLESIGLKYRIKKDSHGLEVVASKSEEQISEFVETRDIKRIGELLGYPKTAVEAFDEAKKQEDLTRQPKKQGFSQDPWLLRLDEEKGKLKEAGFDDDFISYIPHRLSRNNYLEEANEQLEQFNLLKKYGLIPQEA